MANIVERAKPSKLGNPEVKLRPNDYDALVTDKGYDVIHEKAIVCPCKTRDGGAPSPQCLNCQGTGWLFINPVKTRMVCQNFNLSDKFRGWSKEYIGTILIISRYVDVLNYMDRITIRDKSSNAPSIMSQVVYPIEYGSDLFSFLYYPVKEIKEVFQFDDYESALIKLDSSLYSTQGNKIIFDDSLKDVDNLRLSIRYEHEIQYHIIDLLHEVRSSYVLDKHGRDTLGDLPLNAMARRAHYVLDAQNFDGTGSINNSYQ